MKKVIAIILVVFACFVGAAYYYFYIYSDTNYEKVGKAEVSVDNIAGDIYKLSWNAENAQFYDVLECKYNSQDKLVYSKTLKKQTHKTFMTYNPPNNIGDNLELRIEIYGINKNGPGEKESIEIE